MLNYFVVHPVDVEIAVVSVVVVVVVVDFVAAAAAEQAPSSPARKWEVSGTRLSWDAKRAT